MKKVAIFARVNTSIPNYERQANEQTALAVQNKWTVEATCPHINEGLHKVFRK